MNYQLDIFFTNGEGDPVHFERRWNVLPNIGDTVSIDDEGDVTWIASVERRVFVSENDQLRVQLHMEQIDFAIGEIPGNTGAPADLPL